MNTGNDNATDSKLPDEEPHYSCTQHHCVEDDPANCWAQGRDTAPKRANDPTTPISPWLYGAIQHQDATPKHIERELNSANTHADEAMMRRIAKIPCRACGEPSTNHLEGELDGRPFDFGICPNHVEDAPRLLAEATR